MSVHFYAFIPYTVSNRHQVNDVMFCSTFFNAFVKFKIQYYVWCWGDSLPYIILHTKLNRYSIYIYFMISQHFLKSIPIIAYIIEL